MQLSGGAPGDMTVVRMLRARLCSRSASPMMWTSTKSCYGRRDRNTERKDERMPHVIVKLYAGRSEQQKAKLAEEVTKAIMTSANCTEEAVSVSIEDVAPNDWTEKVVQAGHRRQARHHLQEAWIQPSLITAKTAAETLREIGAALASGRATLIAALFADDCIGATFSPSLGTCVPPPALGRSRSAWEPQRWVLFRRRLFAADRRWRLRLCQYADIERFGLEDAPVRDGRVKQADLIELATGHEGQASAARRILGDDVGDPTDPVWGFDEEGEMRGMWRPTGQ